MPDYVEDNYWSESDSESLRSKSDTKSDVEADSFFMDDGLTSLFEGSVDIEFSVD